MKALVYHGPGKKAWEDVPEAAIKDPTDVVVRVLGRQLVVDAVAAGLPWE